MLACNVHLGAQNLSSGMDRYVRGRNEAGNHIIDLRKTWEKLTLAARAIVAVRNPQDVCVIGLTGSATGTPIAQRSVIKFGKYCGARALAGRFTPGTLTNQIQSHYFEPSLLVVSDPYKDHQPLMESSYMNIPVIAFCNTNHNLRHIDIVIPCNTEAPLSVALMYWMLAREVLRLQGKINRDKEWDVMVDMFIYRDEKEADKTDESSKTGGSQAWAQTDLTWDASEATPSAAPYTGDNWTGEEWGGDAAAPTDEYPSTFNESEAADAW